MRFTPHGRRIGGMIALILAGCAPAPAPESEATDAPAQERNRGLTIQTDSLSYGLVRDQGSWMAWALVTFTNTSDSAIYIRRCSRHMTEHDVRPVERPTRIELGFECIRPGGIPHAEVPAHGTYTDSVGLPRSLQSCLLHDEETSAAPRSYRVVYYHLHDRPGNNDDGQPSIPDSSNVFTVSYCWTDPTTGRSVCSPNCPRR